MNEAMKIENIKNYMGKLDVAINKNFIYAQIDAKLWKYALFSGFATLSIQHFLLCFEKDKILLVGVTAAGDFTGKTAQILRTDIKSLQYKKGILQGTLTIKVQDQEVLFKVPKVIAIATWQKENLENLLEKDFKGDPWKHTTTPI